MMTDFRRSDAPVEYDADICIVGSGAAGLTLACNTGGRNRVLVLEAGDRDPGPDQLYWLSGQTSGPAFAGLENGRVRAFGGATRRWFGQCIRLDPIDFEKRAWVPYSGWPIAAEDLAGHYDRAEQFLGVTRPDYDERIWSRFGVADPGLAATDAVQPKFTIYCPQPDFAKAFGGRLARETPEVDVLLNAAAVGIALDADGKRVIGVRIRGGDRQGIVRAKYYVLCGGGIENPRLMLASNDVMANGVGNARDLVGRFFQDHPGGVTGVLSTNRPRRIQEQFRKLRRAGLTYWPKLALTDAAQRRGRYLNANAQMSYGYAPDSAMARAKDMVATLQRRQPAAAAMAAARLLRHTPELVGEAVHTLTTGKAPVLEPNRVMLTAHVEQAPDPESRVSLANDRDRFGMPRARLTWRVHHDEVRTLRGITEAVGRALHRLDFGEMTPEPWLDGRALSGEELVDTYHHAGTTRMAETPQDGVVDPDCRVFGLDNLYVAGSSVFPTSGYANPTLTIVALALRLGDVLKARLQGTGDHVRYVSSSV